MDKRSIISVAKNGEIEYNGGNSYINSKYKADTPMDRSFVPYVVMIFCAAIDATCFLQLFNMISYDSPFLKAGQIAGFLFGFDAVPIYIGIQLKRIKEKITKDRFIMWIAIAVCVIACGLNIILRFATVGEITAEEEITKSAIALTIVGAVIPFITSLGSFFISYLTYNPLLTQKKNLERLLIKHEDEIRRLDALISEYESDSDFEKNLLEDENKKYEEIKKMHRALVLSYCDYVRMRLKFHLANPNEITALSEESCLRILNNLDEELAAIDKLYAVSSSK